MRINIRDKIILERENRLYKYRIIAINEQTVSRKVWRFRKLIVDILSRKRVQLCLTCCSFVDKMPRKQRRNATRQRATVCTIDGKSALQNKDKPYGPPSELARVFTRLFHRILYILLARQKRSRKMWRSMEDGHSAGNKPSALKHEENRNGYIRIPRRKRRPTAHRRVAEMWLQESATFFSNKTKNWKSFIKSTSKSSTCSLYVCAYITHRYNLLQNIFL